MIHHDIIISAFHILMGAPESTPSSFGTSIIAVGPGQEHKLLVTPTYIRSHVGVTFKINPSYTIVIIKYSVLIRRLKLLPQKRGNVCFLMKRVWSCLRITPSATVFWSAILA